MIRLVAFVTTSVWATVRGRGQRSVGARAGSSSRAGDSDALVFGVGSPIVDVHFRY